MSIGPDLLGKKFPSNSGIRPMTREFFAPRVPLVDDHKGKETEIHTIRNTFPFGACGPLL